VAILSSHIQIWQYFWLGINSCSDGISFDHTTNHVEGNKVETVSNHSSVEEKDEAHKVSKEEKISNQNITEEKENVTTLMENVTSVAVTGTTEQVTGTSFTQHFKHNFDQMIKRKYD
jgi:hypothetical protein